MKEKNRNKKNVIRILYNIMFELWVLGAFENLKNVINIVQILKRWTIWKYENKHFRETFFFQFCVKIN